MTTLHTRGKELYISSRTLWLLRQIAKSMSAKISDTDSKITADALADDIIMSWVKQTKPKLIEIFERREALENEAQEILK